MSDWMAWTAIGICTLIILEKIIRWWIDGGSV